LYDLVSHDSDLPDQSAIANDFGGEIAAQVFDYAQPALFDGNSPSEPATEPTAGTLTQDGNNWTLDFGTISASGSNPYFANILVTNGASFSAYTDSLAGSLDVSGSGIVDFVDNIGLEAPPGSWFELGVFEPDLTSLGTNSLTVEYHPLSVDSGGTTALPDITLTVTDDVLCFVRGTLIKTTRDEVAVEQLAVGDRVLTQHGDARSIIWIGVGQVLATRGQRSAATPVIVKRGALADNVPRRDLHITKGHALFIDGVLIPVEFLINHRSIVWNDRAQEVTVYHIELSTHDVLIADGAPAESYRDDGNRWLFRNANSGWGLPPQEPCAPVLTGGSLVDAIWRRLLERAGPRSSLPLTDDPDLHLLVDGKRIDALEQRDDAYVFRLPARPRKVRIYSRAGTPQELGLARDDRPLGVAIRRIVLAQARRQRAIEANAASLTEGFHAFEAGNRFRWTDGDAAVPPELFAGMTGPGMLMLHLGAATQYPDDGRMRQVA
jgi:hypothetical protein